MTAENFRSPAVSDDQGKLQTNSRSVPLLIVLLVICFLAIIALLSIDYFSKKPLPTLTSIHSKCPIVSCPKIDCSTIGFTKLPRTKFKSYPVVSVDSKLTLLPIEPVDNQIIDTGINVNAGEGALYFGQSDPVPSPDLTKTAYLKDRRLWLITGDGLYKVKVSDDLPVKYLSGWSPDSKYLIVYSDNEDIEQMFEGMGFDDTKKFERRKMPAGVYLVDTENGELIWLNPVSSIVSWVNPTQIVTLDKPISSPYSHYVLFDVGRFVADTQILGETFRNHFTSQISPSRNGDKWALALGQPGGTAGQKSFAKIVIADFPKSEGQVIEEGGWAQVQKPILSSGGQRLLYQKYDYVNGPVYVQYWDGNETKRLIEGIPILWVDETKFIYKKIEMGKPPKIFLYNLNANSSLPLNP